jgi:hypothetical protein
LDAQELKNIYQLLVRRFKMCDENVRRFNLYVADFIKESAGEVLIDAIKLGKEIDERHDDSELESLENIVAFTIYRVFKLLINGEEQSD